MEKGRSKEVQAGLFCAHRRAAETG